MKSIFSPCFQTSACSAFCPRCCVGSGTIRDVKISDRIPTGILIKKNPAPSVIVGDPPAEGRTD